MTGPAYCINFGLKNPASSKKLTIGGKYTATPETIGAFANGYPQRSLEDFIKLHTEESHVLANLTREESTLGQVGVPGTTFANGRATLALPSNNMSQVQGLNTIT